MAIRNNTNNDNAQQQPKAQAWLKIRVIVRDADGNPIGEPRYINSRDVPLMGTTKVEQAMIRKAGEDPEFTFELQGTVNVVQEREEEDFDFV